MRNKFIIGGFLLLILPAFFAAANAATFTVTRSDDRNNAACVVGDCSLREAIKAANLAAGSDSINFAGVNSIQLTSALPDISSVISIQGGSGVTVAGDKANSTFRPFRVGGIGNLTLDRMTVVDGKETIGGGLLNQGATVTLTNCTFSGNEATLDGGAIATGGTMTISNSVISVNSAVARGGGINNGGTLTITDSTIGFNSSDQPDSTLDNSTGGGIHNTGFLNIIRSSVSGNITAGNGGGIFNAAVSAVTITNSTISFNSAYQGLGGGVYDIAAQSVLTNATIATNFATVGGGYYGNDTFGSSFFLNTIVADNTGGAATSDVYGRFGSFYSLIGKSDGSTGIVNGVNGNIVGTIAAPVNPQLNPLGNNGGTTQTHSFSSNTSPAINAGSNALAVDQNNMPLTTDQRGAGFQRVNGTAVDIGAFESAAPTAAAVEIGGRVTTADGRGIFDARIALTGADGRTRYARSNPFGYYRFSDVAVGETYIVAVSHKRFQFAQPVQILNVNEATNHLNFAALPLKQNFEEIK